MSVGTFIERQLRQIQQGRYTWTWLFKKIKSALQMPYMLPLYILAVPVVIVFRMIRPWLMVRCGGLISARIGHFAANTELYLCEKAAGINVPKQRHIDLFYMGGPICNMQLATMWKRILRIWPFWILAPISRVNRLIPGGAAHEIGNNTLHDRDVHNLLDRFPPHLEFSPEEEVRGEAGLRAMGIPQGTTFVCLIVRDSVYLTETYPMMNLDYHNYRDSNIQDYILAAEALGNRGYFVIRMGEKVSAAMKAAHPRIIDYAANGLRSDFMDIYLGAKCEFCISTGTGFDSVPLIFRRPIVYVNLVPLGYLSSFSKYFLNITKHYYDVAENRELVLSEIFKRCVGFLLFTSDYESKGIELRANSPEEIRDVVNEMAERLSGTWEPHQDDEALQRRFWEIFPTEAVDVTQGRPLHGEIRARFGAHFLRNNRKWLQ